MMLEIEVLLMRGLILKLPQLQNLLTCKLKILIEKRVHLEIGLLLHTKIQLVVVLVPRQVEVIFQVKSKG